MKKLIRVVRNPFTPEVMLGDGNIRMRRVPQAIITREVHMERTNFTTEGEFFFVDESEVENAVRILAEASPGREVQVYNLEQSAECPAGPIVMKKVTKDGILPS